MISSEVLVKATGLTKKYNHDVLAVDHIDFDVYKGECVGFLRTQRRRKNHYCPNDLLFSACK